MEVGIKLWSTNPVEYVNGAGFADFVEVMPVDAKSLMKFTARKYRYTVHVPHERFGFNPALDFETSLKLLQRGISAAKKLRAKHLIMHTSYLREHPNEKTVRDAIKKTAQLVKKANYDHVLIENSLKRGVFKEDSSRYYICYDYDQLKELLEITGAGFCLDFEHAAITAYQLGLKYEEHVAELLKLKPEYFQLSGTSPALGGQHHHLSIFDGIIDLNFVKKILKKANKPVCLETPIDIEQRKKEVTFLKK